MTCKILDIIEKHGFEIGYKEGFEEGFNEAFEEAYKEIETLVRLLLEQNRIQDLEKACHDKEYLQKLYREFGIA